VELLFRIGGRHYAVVQVERGHADVRAVDQVARSRRRLSLCTRTVTAPAATHSSLVRGLKSGPKRPTITGTQDSPAINRRFTIC
jgi:hypothetical protein